MGVLGLWFLCILGAACPPLGILMIIIYLCGHGKYNGLPPKFK